MRGWLILASAGITSAGSIPSDLAFCRYDFAVAIWVIRFGSRNVR